MDELIATIFDLTVDMSSSLEKGDFEGFEQLLLIRSEIMVKVDAIRADSPDFQYSPKAKQLLKDTLSLDQNLTPLLKENITNTKTILNQIKNNKQISRKYQPIINQSNGVFVDSKQ
jgi:hypothetical protein